MRVYIYVVCAFICTYVCVYMHVCMCMYMYVCVCMCVHTVYMYKRYHIPFEWPYPLYFLELTAVLTASSATGSGGRLPNTAGSPDTQHIL